MSEQETIDVSLMMASIVHDVKNSIGMIQNQVEELVPDVQKHSSATAEKLQRLSLEAGRINNALMHMLGLYRLNEGRLQANIEECYMQDFFQDVNSKFQSSLEMMHINLDIQLHDSQLCWFFDQQFVETIISNVITNAIRYTDKQLRLSTQIANNYLVITLIDDGQGYPASMINCLTEQAELNFKQGSTGLGLFFCQRIAQLHKIDGRRGYIHLDNTPQGGARFRLFLP